MDKNLKKRYEDLKAKVTVRADDFASLMDFIETKTAWLTTPASTRFHLSRENGLLEHSVNVAETLLRMKAALHPLIEDESCVIVALLHDLGKVGMPGESLYIKNEPTERQARAGYGPTYPYRYNSDLTYSAALKLYSGLIVLTISAVSPIFAMISSMGL